MGLRYRKSITIFPGVKLNISKSGLSLSVGKKGAHVTAGTSGRKSVSVGLPGTGVSYTKVIGKGSKRRTLGFLFTAVVIAGALIAAGFSYKDRIGRAIKAFMGQEAATATTDAVIDETAGNKGEISLVINTSTKKIHLKTCRYAAGDNIKTTDESKEDLINKGYTPCKTCNP